MSTMSSFAASLSKRLISRSLPFRSYEPFSFSFARFSSSSPTPTGSESDLEDFQASDHDQPAGSSSPSNAASAARDDAESSSEAGGDGSQRRAPFYRPLENGLDPGVYKAIMVGKVGQQPVQKYLKSGRSVVLFSLGTGGIRNNRRPLDNEEPHEYAERCSVQWHRVSIYPIRLGNLALKHVKPGSILYLEGNLETKVFSDPITGLVRRIREIAIRRDGRLVFLSNDDAAITTEKAELRSVGYF